MIWGFVQGTGEPQSGKLRGTWISPWISPQFPHHQGLRVIPKVLLEGIPCPRMCLDFLGYFGDMAAWEVGLGCGMVAGIQHERLDSTTWKPRLLACWGSSYL